MVGPKSLVNLVAKGPYPPELALNMRIKQPRGVTINSLACGVRNW